MPTLAVAEAAASVVAAAAFTGAGSVAVAACTRDVSTVAAIVVGCVRHIPSQAARVVPDIGYAGRPGRPGYPVAGRGYYRGYGYGAAAVGAAAVGAAAYGAYGAYTTTATMRTAIGSVPGILIEPAGRGDDASLSPRPRYPLTNLTPARGK